MVMHISLPIWRHCVDEHGGEMHDFAMNVTGSYRNDAMIRQITETVKITKLTPTLS